MNKILIAITLISILYLKNQYDSELMNYIDEFDSHTIAHAGGGIDNKTYTNSFKALNYNYNKGFKYFEIDFSFTKDNKLICLHDWTNDIKNSFNIEIQEPPLSIKDFQAINKNSKYEKCTLDSLIVWMKENPNSFIVTDVKDRNIKALKKIKEEHKTLLSRFIPQIYNPKNFKNVKKLGYERVILTLYKYKKSNDSLLDEIKDFYGKVAITMPVYKLDKTFIRKLQERNLKVYTHTINDEKEFKYIQNNFNIDNIYTDFISPSKL